MLEVAIDADEEWDSSEALKPLARAAAEAAIAESDHSDLLTSPRSVEVSVRLTGDEQVRQLNAEWRGKDKATNVLSFPMADDGDLSQENVAGQELLLGDIVLARGVCAAEAAEKAIPIERHAAHLIVHGTLHLLGFDHGDEPRASDMEQREVRALARLGIADPYEGVG